VTCAAYEPGAPFIFVNMPRTSDVQYWFGKRVHAGQERAGDLVFFDYKPGHSGTATSEPSWTRPRA
jgi:cell wall-associated NlpC family hydrolase